MTDREEEHKGKTLTILPLGGELDDLMPYDNGENGTPIEEYTTEVVYGNRE